MIRLFAAKSRFGVADPKISEDAQNSCHKTGVEILAAASKMGPFGDGTNSAILSPMTTRHPQPNEGLVVREAKPKLKKPDLYKVILLNDDYTPMEFVVAVLEKFFRKNRVEATRIMLHVHHNGIGVCGIYARDIAETKVQQVMQCAQDNQHPLQCTMEPA